MWTDPANRDAAQALTSAGLILDSTPVLMAADLAAMDLAATAAPSQPIHLEDLGRINDIAYDHPPQFARVLTGPPPPGTHATGIHRGASAPP